MRCRRPVRSLVLAFALLAFAAYAAPSDLSDDLTARRARLMEQLGPDVMLVLWSAPAKVYSGDVNYEYRQESNLYYLTGVTEEDAILVLMPGNASHREILFLMRHDSARELWQGPTLSVLQATALSGIRTVLTTDQFEPFIAATLGRRDFDRLPSRECAVFFEALAAGRGRVALLLGAERVNAPLSQPMEFARTIRDRFSGFQTVDLSPILTDLRLVKTAYERRILARSVDISSEAQMAGMLAAHPGAYEYEVKAAVEGTHRARGAASWAYPSIVGSGPNATILHYPLDERQMQAGELLLVDAGASYQYMAADLTRTYPVSGTFSPAQKDIYNLVLEAQEEGMKVAKEGGSLNGIHRRTVEVVKTGLLRLGLITDVKGEQYRMWYPHGASHYIGVDVHDVGDRDRPLRAGMTFTIEPGIYVRQSAIDALPRTPENLRLIEAIQPSVTKYADIGIRIEDSFLLDDAGLRRLSATLPRTTEEIETFARRSRSGLIKLVDLPALVRPGLRPAEK